MSACVIGLIGVSRPIVDARGGAPPAGVSFELPTAYVATSPVSRTLDALSLLSVSQSNAVFVSVIALFVAWAILAGRRSDGRSGWKHWAARFAGLVVAVVIVEAVVALAPRPMARVEAGDPNVVRIDFHSHTGVSHDVRKRFTAEDNREWHRSGGFDVAYISDHVTFGGVVAARPLNPRHAGDGTSLLSAVEGRYHKIMSVMLGLTEADTALLNKRGNLLPGTPASGRSPVTIVTIPHRHLDSVTVQSLDSLPHFVAIELVDAAPRGLGQLDREEARIRRIASELRFTLVAASNNHGFGRAVAAWNLMTIPGWRDLSPDSVGRLIEAPLRDRQLDAVTIVKRARPSTHDATLAFTLPIMAHQIVGSLTAAERAAWLVWIWGTAAIVMYMRRRRAARAISS
ncbi:MAG: hypothetical protein Q7S20_05075 [Gemmatimonadaceae bacterium]|nr:hypothetical protein [Gemmatimonadaceae bacterium]